MVLVGNHIIVLEESELPSDMEQAFARQRRRGQTKPVVVHRIYAKHQVESNVHKVVTKRGLDIRTAIKKYLYSEDT